MCWRLDVILALLGEGLYLIRYNQQNAKHKKWLCRLFFLVFFFFSPSQTDLDSFALMLRTYLAFLGIFYYVIQAT